MRCGYLPFADSLTGIYGKQLEVVRTYLRASQVACSQPGCKQALRNARPQRSYNDPLVEERLCFSFAFSIFIPGSAA